MRWGILCGVRRSWGRKTRIPGEDLTPRDARSRFRWSTWRVRGVFYGPLGVLKDLATLGSRSECGTRASFDCDIMLFVVTLRSR